MKLDPLGKGVGRHYPGRKFGRELARTLAESTAIGNGRLPTALNESVKLSLALKAAPPYFSNEIRASSPPRQSLNNSAFSAGWTCAKAGARRGGLKG
jgi:hypothetical protein